MRRLRTLAQRLPGPSWIAFLGAVWIALFLYAGRPLLVAAAAGGMAPFAAWTLLLAISALPLLPLIGGRRESGSLAHWIGYATLAIFSLLLMLTLAGDLVRALYAALQWSAAALGGALSLPMLHPRTISFATLGAAAVLSLVGLFQARRPRITNVAVTIDDLPAELDGYRIVQWSDVHVGPAIRRGFVQCLVERTNALDADAIAITGDLVDGAFEKYRHDVEPLAGLRARDGVFFVTGNHEYYWRASDWVPVLEEQGLVFLKNEHRVIRRGEAKLVMAGVTDPMGRATHEQDPHAALANAPRNAVKVLLSHRPQTAEIASRLGADLQLSGHTHGGQFFPFNLIIRKFQPVVRGLHRIGRTWLYVNRGTGYWGPPSRLGVGGEITVVELRRRVGSEANE